VFLHKNYVDHNVFNNLYVNQSQIDGGGRGIYTNTDLKKGTFLFYTIIDKNVTPPGAMINHCNKPNCYHFKKNNKWLLYSIKNIPKNKELLIDYNNSPEFIKKPDPSWTC